MKMTNKNAHPRDTDNIGNTRHRKMTNKNTQPRDTDNIGNTRHRKMTNKNTQPRDTDSIGNTRHRKMTNKTIKHNTANQQDDQHGPKTGVNYGFLVVKLKSSIGKFETMIWLTATEYLCHK